MLLPIAGAVVDNRDKIKYKNRSECGVVVAASDKTTELWGNTHLCRGTLSEAGLVLLANASGWTTANGCIIFIIHVDTSVLGAPRALAKIANPRYLTSTE